MDSGIYIIENTIDGKKYVGSTINFEKRKKTHFKLLQDCKHWNAKLQRAVLKHGLGNFRFIIIEEVSYEKNIIIKKENYYIKNLNSKENGYNIADASFGDCISNHPNREAILDRIRIAVIERYKNPEERQKHSQPGEKNGMYGKTHTDKVKQKLRDIHASRKTSGYLSPLKGKSFEEIHGSEKSKELKEKLRKNASTYIGDNNPFAGKKHSDEAKTKMRQAKNANNEKVREQNDGKIPGVKPTREQIMKGKISKNQPFVIVDNVEYLSINEASELTGQRIQKHQLHSRNIRFINMCWSNKKKYLINNIVLFESELSI